MTKHEVPKDHPRYQSLFTRESIIEGMHKRIVAEAGLIAHGRGEAFDYLIGEKTNDFAMESIDAACALLLTAKQPVISVNGNVAALSSLEIIKLSFTSEHQLKQLNNNYLLIGLKFKKS